MQPVQQYAEAVSRFPKTKTSSRRFLVHRVALLAFAVVCAAALTGCGNTYRPVVAAVAPVGPAAQPQKFAVAVSNSGPTTSGLATLVDFSGDTVLVTAALGDNPGYLQLDAAGATGYVLNGDGTFNSFAISTTLIASNVLQTTLPQGAAPVAILPQGTDLYIAESGRGAVAQLTQASPPVFNQELPTPPQSTPIYTVGVANAPRVYAISQPVGGGVGTVSAIETSTNTVSSQIAVGRGPVYGVMSSDTFRAYILNSTDGTVSVINVQRNAPDTFNLANGGTASTIPVGVGPLWADFAPTRAEMVVVNKGNGVTPGTLSVINIPLCLVNVPTGNPNCDPANPVDATGFGQVLANVPVGINPVMVTVLSDGSRAYVANQGVLPTATSPGIPGSVSVVNLDSNTVTQTIQGETASNVTDLLVHGNPNWIVSSFGTPTGKVYVTAANSTDLTVIRTDIDAVQTHVTLQGNGVAVRVSAP